MVIRLLILSVGLVVSRTLGPSALGQLSFAQAIVAYALVITDAGLTMMVLREIVRRPADLGSVVSAATAAQALVAGGSILVLTLGASLLPLPPGTGRLIVAFSPLLLGQALYLSYVLQAKGRMGAVAAVKLIRELVATAVGIGLLVLTDRLVWVAIGAWIGQLVADVVCLAIARRVSRLHLVRPRFTDAIDLVRRGSPFLAGAILVQVIINLDVVVIGLQRGDRDVGLYSAAYRLAYYAAMVAGVVVTVAFPGLVAAWEHDRPEFNRQVTGLIKISALIATPLVLAGVIAAPDVVSVLYGPAFTESGSILRILIFLPALAWHNTFAGQALIAAGRQRVFLAVAATSAGVTVVVLLIFVPVAGIVGAAASVMAAELVTATLFSIVVRRQLHINTLRPLSFAAPGILLGAGAATGVMLSTGSRVPAATAGALASSAVGIALVLRSRSRTT